MTNGLQQIRAIVLTVAAVGIAWGAWMASAHVEEWVRSPELMPVVRVCVIAACLSLAEWIYRRVTRA